MCGVCLCLWCSAVAGLGRTVLLSANVERGTRWTATRTRKGKLQEEAHLVLWYLRCPGSTDIELPSFWCKVHTEYGRGPQHDTLNPPLSDGLGFDARHRHRHTSHYAPRPLLPGTAQHSVPTESKHASQTEHQARLGYGLLRGFCSCGLPSLPGLLWN